MYFDQMITLALSAVATKWLITGVVGYTVGMILLLCVLGGNSSRRDNRHQ